MVKNSKEIFPEYSRISFTYKFELFVADSPRTIIYFLGNILICRVFVPQPLYFMPVVCTLRYPVFLRGRRRRSRRKKETFVHKSPAKWSIVQVHSAKPSSSYVYLLSCLLCNCANFRCRRGELKIWGVGVPKKTCFEPIVPGELFGGVKNSIHFGIKVDVLFLNCHVSGQDETTTSGEGAARSAGIIYFNLDSGKFTPI